MRKEVKVDASTVTVDELWKAYPQARSGIDYMWSMETTTIGVTAHRIDTDADLRARLSNFRPFVTESEPDPYPFLEFANPECAEASVKLASWQCKHLCLYKLGERVPYMIIGG